MTQTKLPITRKFYELRVGMDTNDRSIYQVINLESGVVEYDDYILPRSIEALDNLNEKLAQVYAGKVTAAAVANRPNLVVVKDKEKEDGEGSLH